MMKSQLCKTLFERRKTPFYFLLLEGKFYVNMHRNVKRRVFYFREHKNKTALILTHFILFIKNSFH